MHKSGNVLFKIFQMSEDNKGVIYKIACCVSHHHSLQETPILLIIKTLHMVGCMCNMPWIIPLGSTRGITQELLLHALLIPCVKTTPLHCSGLPAVSSLFFCKVKNILPVIGNVEILQFFLELLKSSEEESKKPIPVAVQVS